MSIKINANRTREGFGDNKTIDNRFAPKATSRVPFTVGELSKTKSSVDSPTSHHSAFIKRRFVFLVYFDVTVLGL